jgi:DNA polymerase
MFAMSKTEALTALFEEMVRDASLPLTSNLVFGEGDPDCKVMFIGEAPGKNEDEQKRPFVGRGGQLLRQMIREIGWKEGDVYITNIVKRRPPENRDPSPEEIVTYKPYLTRQIEIVDPKIIVPLGRFAMNYFLPEAKISRDQSKAFTVEGPARPDDAGHSGRRLVVPMFHPAAALRATGVLEEFRKGVTKLPDIIARGKATPVESPPARAEKPKKLEQPRLF